ncbi:hypothetical protein Sru01_04160 [Sphaerisporangium rufum]|uniref:Glycosyltransferase n=1 Tax=Sphaerisporangium rufum TaxID=1381558 RepID=A0A919UX37_9ACTN|nr:glycosyltransferase [Sphaerisporangium rufum]GII75434.1 hypothetical protein Sru01_04160 [Sphaerisporangium rufum]
MRVCVGTIVHHPEDARILHRQIRALRDAGHEVTYVAPFVHRNVVPPAGVRGIDVPQWAGSRHGRTVAAARAALRAGCRDADLLLVHDLPILSALPRRRPPVVWDVRDDVAAALGSSPALPAITRRLLPPLVRRAESRAERRLHLILADASHRDRFAGDHPVIPDAALVPAAPPPASGRDRIVFVGRLSQDRGAAEMVEMARRLRPHGVRLDLIGSADRRTRPLLRDAQRAGLLDWFGYVPNAHAMRMADGALAGLCLPHDRPEHRPALPAKTLDYLARGLPVITTPLPRAASLIGRLDCGVIVPFGDVDAAVRAVLRLRDDPERRAMMGARGHAEARAHHHWPDHAPGFVARLEEWAAPVPLPALGPPLLA